MNNIPCGKEILTITSLLAIGLAAIPDDANSCTIQITQPIKYWLDGTSPIAYGLKANRDAIIVLRSRDEMAGFKARALALDSILSVMYSLGDSEKTEFPGINDQAGYLSSTAFTRPNNADAYAAGDVVGTSPASVLAFSGVSLDAGAAFLLAGIRLRIDAAAIPSGMSGFRLHLFNAAPTAIADNAAFNLPAADRAKYLGYVSIPAPVDLGDTLWAQEDNLNFSGKLAAGSTTLYGVLETTGAYTPTANIVKTISIVTLGV